MILILNDSTHCYIDRNRHLIEYLTRYILFCVLSTLLFIYFILIISCYSIYIFFICSFICMCILPVYSYTFTRSSDSLDLHIQICSCLLLIRFFERITCILRSQSSLLLDHLFPGIFCLFFIPSLS